MSEAQLTRVYTQVVNGFKYKFVYKVADATQEVTVYEDPEGATKIMAISQIKTKANSQGQQVTENSTVRIETKGFD